MFEGASLSFEGASLSREKSPLCESNMLAMAAQGGGGFVGESSHTPQTHSQAGMLCENLARLLIFLDLAFVS